MLESLFNEVAGLKACNFIKKEIQHKFFSVNIAKVLRTPFYRTDLVAASESCQTSTQTDILIVFLLAVIFRTC